MRIDAVSGRVLEGPLTPIYVYEAPVRLWHWVNALAIVVLAVSGYFIGRPLPTLPGEASDNFLLGYIRFAHFAAGYIFAVFFVLRVYWAIVGNKYAREIFIVPFSLLTAKFWKGLINDVLFYLYIKKEPGSYEGHNPLAAVAMFFMYLLGTVWMILSGFALYGEGAGMASWQFRFFTSWLQPLVGDSQQLHTFHRLGMWYLIIFSLAHMYMVVRQDVFTKETIISTMVNGWRVQKP
jgi:Ni/Fe-hydrogenase 1 B-type cytochrome subunit